MDATTEEPTYAPAGSRPRDGWDFALVVVTVGLLAALGVQSLAGTLYAWWAQRTIEGWAASGQPAFIGAMNAVAAPLVMAMVVVMGLCVPKRLLARRALVVVSAGMAALGMGVWAFTGSAGTGLAAYLLAAGGIQVAVVVLTIAGHGAVRYSRDGRLTRIGSGLLHLGFIMFGYVVVALQDSAWMLPVFGVTLLLCVGGTALTFSARRLPAPRPLRDAGPEGGPPV